MNEELLVIIKRIIDLSPDVWQVLIKQVYIDAIENFVLAVVIIVSLYLGNNSLLSYKDSYTYLEWEEANFWRIAVIVFFVFWVMGLIVSGVARFANPEYHAIKMILEAI